MVFKIKIVLKSEEVKVYNLQLMTAMRFVDSVEIIGNLRVETHPKVCELYRYDLLDLPPPLSRITKKPIAVFQPESDDDVLKILKVAAKFKVPLIPRGAASSAYGGVVPIKKSFVVEFSRMRKFRIQKNCVIAESGANWFEIENAANRENLALRVYPTSAFVSTVGGWVAQNGFGVGSLAYGRIGENLEWIEVADFKGIRRVSGEEKWRYVGAYGTTGLILRACVKLRENKPINAEAVSLSLDKAVELLDGGYYAAYISCGAMKNLGLEGNAFLICREGWGDKNALGEHLWNRRFEPLKGINYRPIFSEVLLPLESVADFEARLREFCKSYEIVFSKNEASIFAIFDKKWESYIRALKVLKVAKRYGGKFYGLGMISYVKDKNLREFKRSIDPHNLLNPGKAFQPNLISKIIKIAVMLA